MKSPTFSYLFMFFAAELVPGPGSGTILKSQLANAFVRQLSMTEPEAKANRRKDSQNVAISHPQLFGEYNCVYIASFCVP